METFVGHIKTPQDALIVFEACRLGLLQRVKRRLSTKERINIQSGSIFAFDENEAGMRRWTDGRTWSPSRVWGSFLTYRELETKRRPRNGGGGGGGGGCLSFAYKPNGLIKQSFSICTAFNQKMHLINYYSKADIAQGKLMLPSQDPSLGDIVIPKGLYPELNPLDTSGGHTATLHLMLKASMDEERQQQRTSHNNNNSSGDGKKDSHGQLPSLSSSPLSTCSDDDLPSPSHPSLSLLPQHRHTSIASPRSPSPVITKQLTSAHHSSLLPPAQVWKPYALQSEDTRQLEALKTQMRI